ncbi:MAG: SprT family zinc-dependent metalloprotease [Candidatus Pacearchaeota archaeon]
MQICGLQVQTVKKNIKNMHLGVYPPQGRIRVAAPKKMNDESIRLFIISKIPWIKKQKAKFERQKRQTKREFISGESHYFLGNRYRLNVIDTENKPRVEIKKKTHIDLYVKPNMSREQKEKMLESFYRAELKKQIPELIERWEKNSGVKVNEVIIKKMKTKWGTCNAEDKRIWLNLELAKNPLRCLEYVLLHEMIHFKEKNHTDKFFNLMDSHLPQWPQLRDELNNSVLGFFPWEH